MSDHDLMCSITGDTFGTGWCSVCELIKAVREDEQQNAIVKHNDGAWIRGVEKGRADALTLAREAVAAVRPAEQWGSPTTTTVGGFHIRQSAALAAIDALRGDA